MRTSGRSMAEAIYKSKKRKRDSLCRSTTGFNEPSGGNKLS